MTSLLNFKPTDDKLMIGHHDKWLNDWQWNYRLIEINISISVLSKFWKWILFKLNFNLNLKKKYIQIFLNEWCVLLQKAEVCFVVIWMDKKISSEEKKSCWIQFKIKLLNTVVQSIYHCIMIYSESLFLF